MRRQLAELATTRNCGHAPEASPIATWASRTPEIGPARPHRSLSP
jgi:hypothetical protein